MKRGFCTLKTGYLLAEQLCISPNVLLKILCELLYKIFRCKKEWSNCLKLSWIKKKNDSTHLLKIHIGLEISSVCIFLLKTNTRPPEELYAEQRKGSLKQRYTSIVAQRVFFLSISSMFSPPEAVLMRPLRNSPVSFSSFTHTHTRAHTHTRTRMHTHAHTCAKAHYSSLT